MPSYCAVPAYMGGHKALHNSDTILQDYVCQGMKALHQEQTMQKEALKTLKEDTDTRFQVNLDTVTELREALREQKERGDVLAGTVAQLLAKFNQREERTTQPEVQAEMLQMVMPVQANMNPGTAGPSKKANENIPAAQNKKRKSGPTKIQAWIPCWHMQGGAAACTSSHYFGTTTDQVINVMSTPSQCCRHCAYSII